MTDYTKCPVCVGDGDINNLCPKHQIELLEWENMRNMDEIERLKKEIEKNAANKSNY